MLSRTMFPWKRGVRSVETWGPDDGEMRDARLPGFRLANAHRRSALRHIDDISIFPAHVAYIFRILPQARRRQQVLSRGIAELAAGN